LQLTKTRYFNIHACALRQAHTVSVKHRKFFYPKTLLIFGWAALLAVTGMVFEVKPVEAATGHNDWSEWAAADHTGATGNDCLTAEEIAMFRIINRSRTQKGLPQLELDPKLTAVARTKSRDMVDYHYFGHLSGRLGSVYDQLERDGIVYRIVGENLVGAPGYRRAQQSIMNSPAHRGNVLNANFTKIGVGIAAGGAYRKIFTQIFVD
jgi:uncharacterized protein YkwD